MRKLVYLAAAALLAFFACTPEEQNRIEENVNPKEEEKEEPKEVVATAIELSSHELTMEKGANAILTVTYTPFDVTKKDITWVSSNTSVVTVDDGIVVGVAPGETEIIAKCGDAIDKCKVTVVITATSISLNTNHLVLHIGDGEALIATIEPSNTTDTIEWISSDNTIASVQDGCVTAIAAGFATITVKTSNGLSDICEVTVKKSIPNGAVDLGLSVFWAQCNLGASKPEAYGDFYAWGETEPKKNYAWTNYKFRTSGDYWDTVQLSKYNTKASYGTVDNKTVLDPEDDAAHAKLGGTWRMPTDEEWTELMTKCTWTWTTENGVKGYQIKGPNGNSIFLPAAGYHDGTGLYFASSNGYYWSSSLNSGSPPHSLSVNFYSSTFFGNLGERYRGQSVRPVTE